MRFPLSTLTLLPSLALAGQLKSRSPYVVKGDHPVPARWQRVDRAPAAHPIELRIGLKASQFDELERHLYEGESRAPPLLQPIADHYSL
jgi:hypothetical protein